MRNAGSWPEVLRVIFYFKNPYLNNPRDAVFFEASDPRGQFFEKNKEQGNLRERRKFT